MFKIAIQIVCFVLPWKMRRWILNAVLGFSINPEAYVGLSLILADECVIAAKAFIGHFNYVGKLDTIRMEEDALIGHFNWIGGLSTRLNSPYFSKKANRRSELIMAECSLLMNRHYIDCTDRIEFEPYSALAGVRTQLMTHGVNPISGRQSCSPITIGAYTMIGTGVIILMGVRIPDHCVVSAGSVISHIGPQSYSLIGGNPAVHLRVIPETAKIFTRKGRNVL